MVVVIGAQWFYLCQLGMPVWRIKPIVGAVLACQMWMEEEEGYPFDPVPDLTTTLRQMPHGPPPPPPPTNEGTNEGGVDLVAGIQGSR